jgi:hypothetical protein
MGVSFERSHRGQNIFWSESALLWQIVVQKTGARTSKDMGKV